VKAQVLEQHDVLGAGVEHELGDAVADDLVGRRTSQSSSSARRAPTGSIEYFGSARRRVDRGVRRGSAGRHAHAGGAASAASTDARVVADLAALERDVEVDPTNTASILDVEVVQRGRGRGLSGADGMAEAIPTGPGKSTPGVGDFSTARPRTGLFGGPARVHRPPPGEDRC
jgi:hypothetical protein